MPRFSLLLPLFLALIFVSSSGFFAQQDLQFSKAQVQSDMLELENILQSQHPNLFLYTSLSTFKSQSENWRAQLPEQMNGPLAYSAIARYSSLIKDGHTLFYPGKLISQSAPDYSFPFRIYIDEGKFFTEHNYSSSYAIPNGSEILSINQMSCADLLHYLQERMMNDGNNYNYTNWVLHHFFSSYYAFCFGNPAEFEIAYKDTAGENKLVQINALSSIAINANRSKRYANFTALYQEGPGNGITLEFKPKSKLAILTIRDFHQSILKKTYQQQFKKTINNYFSQIKNNKTEKLILDLRNNQGGKIAYSHLLLQHLLVEPFQMLAGYARVNKKNASDSVGRLKEVSGEKLGDQEPKESAFTGELIVLINGGSFSNTGIFCSTLKKYQRATFIGEETGGSAHILSADSKRITLSNTEIEVDVPRLRYTLQEVGASGLHGVRPDILLKPTIADLIQHKDVVMERAMNQ